MQTTLSPFARLVEVAPRLPEGLGARLLSDPRGRDEQAAACFAHLMQRWGATWLDVCPETRSAAELLRCGAKLRQPYEMRRRLYAATSGAEPPWDLDPDAERRTLASSADPHFHALAFDLLRDSAGVALLSACYGRTPREVRRAAYPPMFHLVLEALALALVRGVDLAPVVEVQIAALDALSPAASER
jgi:hypothetical protein